MLLASDIRELAGRGDFCQAKFLLLTCTQKKLRRNVVRVLLDKTLRSKVTYLLCGRTIRWSDTCPRDFALADRSGISAHSPTSCRDNFFTKAPTGPACRGGGATANIRFKRVRSCAIQYGSCYIQAWCPHALPLSRVQRGRDCPGRPRTSACGR